LLPSHSGPGHTPVSPATTSRPPTAVAGPARARRALPLRRDDSLHSPSSHFPQVGRMYCSSAAGRLSNYWGPIEKRGWPAPPQLYSRRSVCTYEPCSTHSVNRGIYGRLYAFTAASHWFAHSVPPGFFQATADGALSHEQHLLCDRCARRRGKADNGRRDRRGPFSHSVRVAELPLRSALLNS